jgi:hypothetical protein
MPIRQRTTATALALCLLAGHARAIDLASDTWVATDGLGRSRPAPREDRFVALFYFLWLGHHGTSGPFDISRILDKAPEDRVWGPRHAFHHWAEPELGYYLSVDEYVIRRHVHMFIDAGIDALFVDFTNAVIYEKELMALCRVLQEIRDETGQGPRVAFFAHHQVIERLYDLFYARDLYPELWFHWEGKPLILPTREPEIQRQEVREFFTIRRVWGLQRLSEPNLWSFLQHYPQDVGRNEAGEAEFMSVSIAQQETYMTEPTAHGRSYHDGREPPPEDRDFSGRNFAEQWERALEHDPRLVFVTGWNEWVAQRFEGEDGQTRFVDAFTAEFSRDIEPMRGGFGDAFYYQLVEYVRRFKGARAAGQRAEPGPAVVVDGLFEDWAGVEVEYRDTPFDTAHRQHPAWGAGTYVETSGRNDIVRSRVAFDAENVYFYARTREPLTPPTDPNWMLLFIDSDQDSGTGWHGYDLLVNGRVTDETTTTVMRTLAGGWVPMAEARLAVADRELELAVPRSCLPDGTLSFDFHWADNPSRVDSITELTTTGDNAPNRRFNYRFIGTETP